jgi:hypothetical protein
MTSFEAEEGSCPGHRPKGLCLPLIDLRIFESERRVNSTAYHEETGRPDLSQGPLCAPSFPARRIRLRVPSDHASYCF